MKPEDNNTVNEQNLDADLNSIGQAYHRAPGDEPPDLLDQVVLNKARLAAGVRRSGWHFGGFRWISAFATASIVVVSLALVMEQVSRPPMSDGLPAQPSLRTESYEIDVISADDANELIDAEEVIVSADREALEFRAKQDRPAEQNIELRAAAEAPARSRVEGAATPAAVPPPIPAKQQKRSDVRQQQDEFADQSAIVTEQKAMLEKSEADADTQEGARDVMDTPAEPVAESDLGAITVSGHAIAKPPPPDVWIKQIIHWKHMQLNERFEREFARFRKVYPDYELPDELANIIREGQ